MNGETPPLPPEGTQLAAFVPGSLLHRLRGLGQGDGKLLPQGRLAGPMPWVVAIMVALTVIAAAAGLALSNMADTASAELSSGLTVQILEAAPDARAREAEAALGVLAHEPGVSAVRLVPESEVDALLSPWLGASFSPGSGDDDLPVPALIDAHLDGAVSARRLADLRHDLAGVAPAARLDAQASWLRPVFGAIASLQWLALALIALLAAAMAAAVLLAARSALGAHRTTIEIIHMLGATDRQVARIFSRSFGTDAAVGGLIGLALALVVIIGVGLRFDGLGAGLVAGGALSLLDWLVLAAIPLAATALAMLTARLSVVGALRKMV